MRLALAAMAVLMAFPAAAQSKLELHCAGAFVQGGVALCKTAPGANVTVDGGPSGQADAQGLTVIGFERDFKGVARVVAASPDGRTAKAAYPIAARKFSIQRVDGLPAQTVSPTDPEVLKKIERDTALKAQSSKSRAALSGWLDGFRYPVAKYRVSGQWGNQRVLNGKPRPPHFGVDLAAPTGTAIGAPAAGVVTLAQPDMHFEGGLVILDHGQGFFSFYLHMSRIDVALGQQVAQGQALGAVGATGRATGPHLCWRLRWRDRQLDPTIAVEALTRARTELGV